MRAHVWFYMEIRGQLVGVHSLLPCGFQGSSSGYHVCWWVSLSADLSLWGQDKHFYLTHLHFYQNKKDLTFFFYNTKIWTWDLVHSPQVLYHWALWREILNICCFLFGLLQKFVLVCFPPPLVFFFFFGQILLYSTYWSGFHCCPEWPSIHSQSCWILSVLITGCVPLVCVFKRLVRFVNFLDSCFCLCIIMEHCVNQGSEFLLLYLSDSFWFCRNYRSPLKY